MESKPTIWQKEEQRAEDIPKQAEKLAKKKVDYATILGKA